MDPDLSSSRRLAAIVESSDDAIISKDLDGTIVTWNPAAERLFGFTAAEAVGRSIRIIIPADRQREEDLVIARIRAGLTVAHFETVRVRKDGTEVQVSLTVSPVHDADGRVVGASKIARDISERIRAAHALASTEAARADLQRRLLTLVTASGSLLGAPTLEDVLPAILVLASQLVATDGYAVWRLRPDRGAWEIASAQGVSDEFCHTTATSFSEARDRALLREPLVAADLRADPRVAGRREAYEKEGLRSMLAVPLRIGPDIAGTLVFYSRVPRTFDAVDVQAATALANIASAAMTGAMLFEAQRRSRQESDFLAASGKTLASSLDYHDTLTSMARLAVPYFADWCAIDLVDDAGEMRRLVLAHVDPERIDLATRFEARFPEDEASPYSARHVVRTGKPVLLPRMPPDEHLVASARSGEHLEALRSLRITSAMRVPVRVRNTLFGVMTFVSAESGREYTERELALAEEVAARAGLAVDNAQAYAEIEGANRMKDEFLATLSHELRTPLNALLGYARMLKWQMVPPDHHARAFDVIERNGTVLARLVEDILDVSRVVTGKVRLTLKPTDLRHVVAQSLDTVAAAALAKQVAIQTHVEAALPLAMIDADRLQQALWNLLSNAVKFTPSGGRVDVSVRHADSQFEIIVRDTGIGIAPEFLPRVFERFRQADSRYAREHGGLGLGLAIARHLTEMHGGTLTAQSDGPGLGATFTMRLPAPALTAAEIARDEAVRREVTPDRPVTARLDAVRVVAVDDEPDEASMIREALESAGAEVRVAHSGPEALDLLRNWPADVLLADIGMPDMDGFELIRHVRALPGANAAVAATAITAYTKSHDRSRALTSGFNMHLSKPVDPAELIAAVHRLLGR